MVSPCKQLATISEAVTCSVLLHAVFVTWNGTRITGPVLICHDEISVDPARSLGDITAPGALVCTSETRPRSNWRRADYSDGPQAPLLSQIRSDVPSRARLSRDNEGVNPSFSHQNGLWCCQVNSVGDDADVVANFVFAGVYRRGVGECRGEGGRGNPFL